MRLQSLLALAATSALLLPLTANAGAWPGGSAAKGAYMDKCIAAASQQKGVTSSIANTHCKCGADALEKNFTTEQIQQLDGPKPSDELIMKAQQAVTAACAPKK
ncbi:hypothetical protein [Pseudomonas fontis]|uniref:Secreted protein n=1 Tax=Pseudomonas fontis TaxID=2942633 RepID=A0ABT5NLX9_9PSED|nr:hypothetical protein [Pseudomonas fontis]MDD0974920.1 hypothetical protein [Pseudomonas fontis]MDD0989361.1 hypothetical protein [Pseudomonas fontis]